MKIFVTVGTTRFDSLIDACRNDIFFRSHDCVVQTGPGGGKVETADSFEYTNDIERFYVWADVIVTHAGAGSIYRLLELKKKLVIVPNLDRLDKHQLDIATFMSEHGYALSISDVNELSSVVSLAYEKEFREFVKEDFFAAAEVLDFVSS
ncbi:PssE/Cps14G family polysaccharide biosynthesis glycosyltransferase [Zoogloea sp.]|uniref:PssE/Cps14G family polysaccharide biosynthesis glycosyltransferase n=1 Tax=Zoogloea sp. TaxID=49181 RepID=UPI0035B4BF76